MKSADRVRAAAAEAAAAAWMIQSPNLYKN